MFLETIVMLTLIGVVALYRKVNKLMPNLQERFDAANARLDEASSEILAEIAKLKEGTLSSEQEAALANIETKIAALAEVSPPVG